jgi:hypothetical protein
MDVLLWSGNGSNPRTFTGLNFSPDFVWIKTRNSGAWSHCLFDQLRGNAVLHTNLTNAETATHPYGYVSAFTSDGFTVAAGSSGDEQVNDSALTYVGWTWDAGDTTVTNTDGSISSQVRANASAGFSVVTYATGTNSVQTVGHGLGVAPQMIIIKERNQVNDWFVYHVSIGNGNYLRLNTTNASTASTFLWNTTSPTSSVYTIRSGGSAPTFDGRDHVAYCFAPVAGYSSAFSYTGNGSSDGPAVYLGFRPALILVKRTDSTGDWRIWDLRRDGYNVTFGTLAPNSSNAENTGEGSGVTGIDFLSNGFKLRSTGSFHNASGGTYVGFAWAEHPFQYARAR